MLKATLIKSNGYHSMFFPSHTRLPLETCMLHSKRYYAFWMPRRKAVWDSAIGPYSCNSWDVESQHHSDWKVKLLWDQVIFYCLRGWRFHSLTVPVSDYLKVKQVFLSQISSPCSHLYPLPLTPVLCAFEKSLLLHPCDLTVVCN